MAHTIEAWNENIQDTETTPVDWDTKVKLGCEGEPVISILEWADLQDIDSLTDMCDYINDLDFNVEVVR